jgi:hypothetical protein
MRSRVTSWGVMATVVAAFGMAGSGYAAEKSATFDLTAVQSSPQGQMTITNKVWITTKRARLDLNHPLQGKRTVLVSDGWIFELDMANKRGVKSPLPEKMKTSTDNFAFLMAQFGVNGAPVIKAGKKVKTEKAAGYTCDVYQHSVSKPGATRTIRVWMPQKMDPKFAVKAIIDSTLSKPGVSAKESLTITLANIKLNTALAASTFAVPAGFKVVEGKVTPPGKG